VCTFPNKVVFEHFKESQWIMQQRYRSFPHLLAATGAVLGRIQKHPPFSHCFIKGDGRLYVPFCGSTVYPALLNKLCKGL
jgi:hypothetical protein